MSKNHVIIIIIIASVGRAIAKAAGKGNRPDGPMPLTSDSEDRIWKSGVTFGDLSKKLSCLPSGGVHCWLRSSRRA